MSTHILFQNDPPLSGEIEWKCESKAIIRYKQCTITLEKFNLYVYGKPMFQNSNPGSVPEIETGKRVFFEAIANPYSQDNCDFYATLAWVGSKPPLRIVAHTVQGPPPAKFLSKFLQHTFVGKVLRFYFPRDALVRIRIGNKPTVVGLSVDQFSTDPKALISDFLHYRGHYIKFKIRKSMRSPLKFWAFDIAKPATEKDYKAFCEKSNDWCRPKSEDC